jgi:hypothetical protein
MQVAWVPEPEVVFPSLLGTTAHIAAAWTVRPEEVEADGAAASPASAEAATGSPDEPATATEAATEAAAD